MNCVGTGDTQLTSKMLLESWCKVDLKQFKKGVWDSSYKIFFFSAILTKYADRLLKDFEMKLHDVVSVY